MGLTFADGFDVQFASDDPGLWSGTDIDSYGSIQYLSSNPRSGNGHVRFSTTSGVGTAMLSLSKSSDAYAWIAGGFYFHSGISTDDYIIIQYKNPDGYDHLKITFDQVTGNLYFGDQGSIDKFGTTSVTLDAYHWIEVKFYCDSSAGYCVAYVDEVEVANFSGDTQYSVGTNVNITEIKIGIESGKGTMDVDDFMLMDQNGSSLTGGFAGPSVVSPMYPDGDNTAGWTSTEATNYEAVDDVAVYGNQPDDDLTNISSDTVGAKSKWTTTSPVVVGGSQVHGVVTHLRVKKDGTGSANIKQLIQVGASGTEGASDVQGMGTSYGWNHAAFDTNPTTSSSFTLSDLDDLIIGVEVA